MRDNEGKRRFPGEGEMARRMREYDWADAGLGDPADWPATLQEAARICVTSSYPIIVGWGPQLRTIYNDAFAVLLGNKHPKALGRPAEQVWHEVWDVLGPLLHSVLETGRAVETEEMLLPMRRHGYVEETYWTSCYSPLYLDDGTVGGVFAACEDSTDRVLAERRLALLRDLGTQAGAAHTVEEACRLVAGMLEQASRDVPFAAVYARRPDGALDLLATSPDGVDPPARSGGPGGWPLQEALRTGRPVAVDDVIERFGALPSGGWQSPPSQAMVLPMPDSRGVEPVGVIVLASNAGRRMDEPGRAFLELVARQAAVLVNGALTYQEQRERAEDLAELNRDKTTFFFDISHEFRTPLNLIMGPLEDLRARVGPTDRRVREDLELIRHSGLQMQKLVNTMLDYASVEAGRMRAHYGPVDLAAFTSDLAGVFRAAVEKAGLGFEVDCPPLPEPVYVDREMWEKIVLNLISNALKFTFEGSIGVRLRAEDGHAVLQVSDTGIGVSEQDLPLLFERFHRVRAARARSIEGSGIGLALVRELVHLHGGTVTVDSTEGEGSTFTVRLPFGHAHLPDDSLAPPTTDSVSSAADPFVEEALHWLPDEQEPEWESAPEATEPLFAGAEPRIGGRARVLVADDNADMRDYLRRLLRVGYEVKTVADGRQALEEALADPPDLVISDVMMPGMDGLELVSALRAHPATEGVPVLLLSALAGEGPSAEGLAVGADDYLVKPFSTVELLARVRANVEMSRLRHQHASWHEAMFDSLQEAFFVGDDQGAVIEVNKAFASLLGYGSEGLPYALPHPWWPDPDTEPDAYRYTAEIVTQMVGRHSGHHVVPLRHRDGHRVWVSTLYNEIRTPDTGERRIVGTLRDITAERAAAQRDMALANMSLRLSGVDTLQDTLRAALQEMAELWEPRQILAATRDEIGRVRLTSGGAEIRWEDLPPPVPTTINDLCDQPPLRPVTFTEPPGVGITLEHFGGPLVLWMEPDPHRPFTSGDRSLLIALCGYLSQSLQRISLVSQQREIVLEFQRAILSPGELPAEFTVRYEPATRPLQVGGDWYDVFALPDGRTGIVVGDSVGHGVVAAAVMGQLRSACRALLLQLADPAAVLAALDDFAELIPNAIGTTVFCGVLDPSTGRLIYSSAGHLPGIGVRPDGHIELLEGARGTPLAVLPGLSRPVGEYLVQPGSILLLYTDGLIERRDRSLDDGIAVAAAVLREERSLPLEDLAQRIMTRLIPEDGGHDDDVALLLYSRPPGLYLSFPAEADRLAPVRAELRQWLEEAGLDAELVHNVLTAAGEACDNAVEHAYGDDPGGMVRLTASITGDELRVVVRDFGRWQVPDPDVPRGRGRGLALIRGLMREVSIESGPAGTTVDMRTGITS